MHIKYKRLFYILFYISNNDMKSVLVPCCCGCCEKSYIEPPLIPLSIHIDTLNSSTTSTVGLAYSCGPSDRHGSLGRHGSPCPVNSCLSNQRCSYIAENIHTHNIKDVLTLLRMFRCKAVPWMLELSVFQRRMVLSEEHVIKEFGGKKDWLHSFISGYTWRHVRNKEQQSMTDCSKIAKITSRTATALSDR